MGAGRTDEDRHDLSEGGVMSRVLGLCPDCPGTMLSPLELERHRIQIHELTEAILSMLSEGFTLGEAAEHLGVSTMTVYRRMRDVDLA